MRRPEYISPTALHKFEWDWEHYAIEYLLDERPPREPQTVAMAVGSAFDARLKGWLHDVLYGPSPEWSYEAIFEQQVEPHVRDEAHAIGHFLFGFYADSGLLEDLLDDLANALTPPRFEFAVRTTVGIGVPLLGKPDISYINRGGFRVVLDGKVNGWEAADSRIVTPKKGFMQCHDYRKDKTTTHKNFDPVVLGGATINKSFYMEQIDKKWADQLATYGWALGEPVGSEDIIYGIEQFTGPVSKRRFARHRCRISAGYQFELLRRYEEMWDAIINNRIMSEEEAAMIQENLKMERVPCL